MTPVTVVGAGFAGCEAAWHPGSEWHSRHPLGDEAPEVFPGASLPGLCRADLLQLLQGQPSGIGGRTAQGGDGTAGEPVCPLCQGDSCGCRRRSGCGPGPVLGAGHRKDPHIIRSITVREGEVTEIPDGNVIIATGPLTSDGAGRRHRRADLGEEASASFDAAAPIVDGVQHRYGQGVLRCPVRPGGRVTISTAPLNKEEL